MTGPTLWATRQQAEANCPPGGTVQHVPNTTSWLAVPPATTVPAAWTGAARNTDPATSHQAATHVNRDNDQALVLRIHAAHPDGLTDFELADLCNRAQTSLGKRRGELRDAGYIEDTGGTRPAPSGAAATVWRITPQGIRAVRRAA